ncbi:hypothetical protein VV11_021965 [Trichodesmium erythraeum 21-75]|nr:hypothetical protein [Trichodesmium erythraeum 21-75]
MRGKVDIFYLLNSKLESHAPTPMFTKGGFKFNQHKVYVAKVDKLKIFGFFELPSEPL